jgi:hypothetical protein
MALQSNSSSKFTGLTTLEEHDPILYDIIEQEKNRQFRGLELIAYNLNVKIVFLIIYFV